ncbi:hypothetical protein AMTR_s00254p00018400 [Amborella trichopoda]|uniref:Uncharacterized protein n=1 Tax=Amborella trichopoda TaxID=13333 RepID=W1NLY3_AMBTC|nr:hypothetical protein AMTR_s00254p00018400 [Amborella trichopoda]
MDPRQRSGTAIWKTVNKSIKKKRRIQKRRSGTAIWKMVNGSSLENGKWIQEDPRRRGAGSKKE